MKKTNKIANLINPSVRVQNLDWSDQNAVIPKGIELCICRIPIRKKDGYDLNKFKKLAATLKNNMTTNGIVFFICYAPIESKSRPFEVAKAMTEAGFNHVDNIVIKKSWFPGKRSENNLVNSHEYVLYFCNGDSYKLDRQPIREYLKIDDDQSCIGNTWTVEVGSLDEAYSEDLCRLLIQMTDLLPGSLLIDPFGGSSSIVKIGLEFGHTVWVFEQDDKKIKKYDKIMGTFKKDQ